MAILFLFASVSAVSVSAATSDDIELTREVIQAERKALVANNMNMTDTESQAFWPIYNEYREALRPVGDRKVKLITGYAKNYETLSDEKAESMLKEFLSIKTSELKVRKRYARKFKKVLPAKKVFRFYQIENKLDAIINVQLAQEIPLAR